MNMKYIDPQQFEKPWWFRSVFNLDCFGNPAQVVNYEYCLKRYTRNENQI